MGEVLNLNDTLNEYRENGMYPFHMPGHKRRVMDGINPYVIDMTEVEGVDDLHDPEGPILKDQQTLAKLYGADESYILVGGSTVGNLAAIYAATNEGDRVLIQRNSHKSVYNALTLRHNKVSYLYPNISEEGYYLNVTAESISEALEKEEAIKALVITTPSYEGMFADLREIAKICHQNDVTLIVDAAHGAHTGFHECFGESIAKIADICVMSLHKTMPSLTQTAVLHVKGKRVDRRKIREALDIFETSSPSYVLMNSISRCCQILESFPNLFNEYVENLNEFYKRCGDLKNIQIINYPWNEKDYGKIVISTKNTELSGVQLAKILRVNYNIETELSSFAYVIAMTSIMDTKEGFEKLIVALHTIDQMTKPGRQEIPSFCFHPKRKSGLWRAKAGEESIRKISEANGQTSATMVCIYPPGAPIIVPGEEITSEVISLIEMAQQKGLHVTGVRDGFISVVN